MKSILLSILILVCWFLAGCELIQQNEYYHLPDSRRSLLRTDDYQVYEDCNSRLDTFRVLKKVSGKYKSPRSGSNCGEPAAYFDLELVYLVNQKEKDAGRFCSNPGANAIFGSCEGYYDCKSSILFLLKAMESKKATNSSSNQPSLTWYGGSVKYPNLYYRSLTVLNKSYSNVYYYEGEFIHNRDSIRGIYYSCQYGIIQMNLMNGNELKLVK